MPAPATSEIATIGAADPLSTFALLAGVVAVGMGAALVAGST